MFKVGDQVLMLDMPHQPIKIEELIFTPADGEWSGETLHAKLEGFPRSHMDLSQLTPLVGFTGPYDSYADGRKKRAPIPDFDAYKEQVWKYDPEGKGQFVYRVIDHLLRNMKMTMKTDFHETAETLGDGGGKEVYLHEKFAIITFWWDQHWDIVPVTLEQWRDYKHPYQRALLNKMMDAELLSLRGMLYEYERMSAAQLSQILDRLRAKLDVYSERG